MFDPYPRVLLILIEFICVYPCSSADKCLPMAVQSFAARQEPRPPEMMLL
jgi:hypothetical protein